MNKCFDKKKSESEQQVEDSFINALDVFSLPLKSQYKLFTFTGLADGTVLTPNFQAVDIQGKRMVIKGIKIVPYYDVASEDFEVTDGVTTNTETIPADLRIDRLFDNFNSTCILNIVVNGSPLNCFPFRAAGVVTNFDLNLELDNIFYLFPAALSTLEVRLTSNVLTTFAPLTANNPNVRIFFQCYLI